MKCNSHETHQQNNENIHDLFKVDKYNATIKCNCNQQIQFLCISNCGNQSLACNNKKCKLSIQSKHVKCKIIFLSGLTEKIKSIAKRNQHEFFKIFEAEEKIISQIRLNRKKLVDSIIIAELSQQQNRAIQQIYTKQNRQFILGHHLEEFYNRDSQIKNTRQYQKLIDEYEAPIKNLRNNICILRNMINIPKTIMKRQKMNSFILNFKEQNYHQNMCILMKYLNYPQQINLEYRASEHEFSPRQFHKLCDGMPNLLVLAKTDEGKIIGGFNSEGWRKKYEDQDSANGQNQCFLFSISPKLKMHLVQPQLVMYRNLQFRRSFSGIQFMTFSQGMKLIQSKQKENRQPFKAFPGMDDKKFSTIEYQVFSIVH